MRMLGWADLDRIAVASAHLMMCHGTEGGTVVTLTGTITCRPLACLLTCLLAKIGHTCSRFMCCFQSPHYKHAEHGANTDADTGTPVERFMSCPSVGDVSVYSMLLLFLLL